MRIISKVALLALLGTTAMVDAHRAAFAQEAVQPPAEEAEPDQGQDPDGASEEIVVRGIRIPDEKKATSEIASLLDEESFIRTGDSDIGGALRRVTGVSLSEGKFVIVRGLNERYSSVTLDGSPLPSPEPLRRVVPLDIVPTSVLSGTLVQKTFSPQFSAEFGGGLVELRSKAIPNETYFQVGLSVGYDGVTTGQRGLTYDGGNLDFLGFDDGARRVPGPVAAQFFANPLTPLVGLSPAEQNAVEASLENTATTVLFSDRIPPNFSVDLAFGGRKDLSNNIRIGGNVALGFSNDYQIRDGRREQGFAGSAAGADFVFGSPAPPDSGFNADAFAFDFQSTQLISQVTGLGSFGLEIGDNHKFTSTTLILRSTLKDARVSQGIIGSEVSLQTEGLQENFDFFERQVWQTQLRGEHKFPALGDLELAYRGAYGKAFRDAPYNRSFLRIRNAPTDPFLLPILNSTGLSEVLDFENQASTLSFSFVDDDNIDAGIDLKKPFDILGQKVELKGGYSYTNKERDTLTRDFFYEVDSLFTAAPGFSDTVNALRNDVFLSPAVVGSDAVNLVFPTPVISQDNLFSSLVVHAAYFGVDAEIGRYLRIAAGGRYETSEQLTTGVTTGQPGSLNTVIVGSGPILQQGVGLTTCSGLLSREECDSNYLLPAATITYNPIGNLQLRVGYSQTIARPQFRELTPAIFIDDDTDLQIIGNPFLVNTEFENIDARVEYYFSRGQFVTLGGFYKDITRPIEATNASQGDEILVTFVNAPAAELYGFEFEFERMFPIGEWLNRGPFGPSTELVFKTNYTWSQSSVSTEGNVVSALVSSAGASAALVPGEAFIVDGRQLQGQSNHLVNISVGLENPTRNMKATLLASWASERIRQTEDLQNGAPAVFERVPFSLDFVFSRTFQSPAGPFDLGFKVRNILGDNYEATQDFADGSVAQFDVYSLGRELSASISKKF